MKVAAQPVDVTEYRPKITRQDHSGGAVDKRLADLTNRDIRRMKRRDLDALWRDATPLERRIYEDRVYRMNSDMVIGLCIAATAATVLIAVGAYIDLLI